MAIPQREQNLLFLQSGGRCAFPDCRRSLVAASSPADGPAILGEMAHIVAERPNGPRGNSPMTLEERNKYDNLILLCNIHHQFIDDTPHTYPVEKLHQMKREHEEWVSKTLGRGVAEQTALAAPPIVPETVHSTLLPVERMPAFVFGAPCDWQTDPEVKQRLHVPRPGEMLPFILREGMLFAFQDLRDPESAFRDVVDARGCQRFASRSWWDDPSHMTWFVHLLNNMLNKLTGHRGLNFDRRHKRYFFEPAEPGQELAVEYRPLNLGKATRSVVWQPKRKLTGEGQGYWYHRAVGLRFHRIAPEEWCLSIRPELHVTTDGVEPLASEKIGSRVTHKKSRMFNYDLLGEVHFWRDFLSDSSPRIIARFGGQALIMVTTLAHGDVMWPGVPPEHAMPFKNVQYLDDLFTWAELAEIDKEYAGERADWEEWSELDEADEIAAEGDEQDDSPPGD